MRGDRLFARCGAMFLRRSRVFLGGIAFAVRAEMSRFEMMMRCRAMSGGGLQMEVGGWRFCVG